MPQLLVNGMCREYVKGVAYHTLPRDKIINIGSQLIREGKGVRSGLEGNLKGCGWRDDRHGEFD